MSEDAFWSNVKPVLHGLDPRRVETGGKDGIPDVNTTEGWIELKVTKWPKKEATPVNFDHYTQQQRVWHIRRCRAGGKCFVLVRIGTDVLLFWGEDAARVCGTVNAKELSAVAIRHWKRGAWKKELKGEILKDRPYRGKRLFDDR